MISNAPFAQSWQREWQWLRGSPWDMAMIFWLPLGSVFFIWWLFAAQIPFQLPIGVWDQDHSSLSRQITRYLDATPGLRVAAQYSDGREAQAALQAGAVYAVMYLPNELSNNVKSGQPANVVLNVNAQFGTHSGLIERDVKTTIGTLSAGIQMQMLMAHGQPAEQAQASFSPLQSNNTALFNVAGNYQLFLGSVLIPALLHIFAVTAGAYSVGRELRDKILGQWLGTRIDWATCSIALLGKLAPAMLALSLVTGISMWLIAQPGVDSLSALLTVYLSLCLLIFLSLVIGASFSLITGSLRIALSGGAFMTSPAFAFSGTGFPLLAMSSGAYAWAMLLPFTHHALLQVKLLQMQGPVSLAIPALIGFTLASVVFFAVDIALLQRALKRPEKWGAR